MAKRSEHYQQMVEQETLILEATELICMLLEKDGVSRVELAEKLDKTKALISQLLNGHRNMTLRTLADMAFALGYRIKVDVERLETT